MEKIFEYARKNNISDIHIIEGERIYFRKDGEIVAYEDNQSLSREDILKICSGKFEEDFAYIDSKNQRYRINSFFTKGKLALVIRVINDETVKLKGEFINKVIDEKILALKDGLVLISGITGSGKSTTLANIIEKFNDLLGEEKVKVDEPMKRHTTFRIGGPADYFLLPSSEEELSGILKICKNEELPYFILGNGSNLLVSDEGYRGVIIQLYRNYGDITVKGNEIHATAGALLSQIAAAAKNASLTGFEFAGGIPGTLGGAVVMNAGAYGGEMKDVLKEVTVMTAAGEILVLPAEKLEMGYRTSLVKTKGYLVLSAVIVLEQGNQEAIKARMKELTEQRVSKQPLEFPSAGSTFKRPEGYFAGKLIMDAGLRGYQTGGAQVSEKHCGFVINKDNATAADVCRLLRDVQDKVKEQFGVTLEPEVKFLGKF